MVINDIYLATQGEGKLLGRPTVFIRTAGCNIKCAWCDTLYAHRKSAGKPMTVTQILEKVECFDPVNTVCVTGGEPLLQKEMPNLLAQLVAYGYRVQLETNGSLDVSDAAGCLISMDVKCPSSKMQHTLLTTNLNIVNDEKHQIKFVIADDTDYDYAQLVMRDYGLAHENCIFLPMGGVELKRLMEKVQKDRLNVMVSPQLHKIVYGNKRKV